MVCQKNVLDTKKISIYIATKREVVSQFVRFNFLFPFNFEYVGIIIYQKNTHNCVKKKILFCWTPYSKLCVTAIIIPCNRFINICKYLYRVSQKKKKHFKDF